jgi:hypothetical protein
MNLIALTLKEEILNSKEKKILIPYWHYRYNLFVPEEEKKNRKFEFYFISGLISHK